MMASNRHEDTDSPAAAEDNDTSSSSSSSPFNIQRPLYFTILFLSLTIFIDTACTIFGDQTNNNSSSSGIGGPLQNLAEFIIPQFVKRYPTTPLLFANEEIGIDGKICPPDSFLDRALLSQSTSQANKVKNGITYSSDYDPRNKKSKPSSFPHCELKKWVQLDHLHQKEEGQRNTDVSGTQHNNNASRRQCPKGEEYVTHIYPKQLLSHHQRKNTNKNKNVKIIHIATPTNCIPTSTISSLQSFTEHYYNNPNPQIIIAIYIHSQETIDAFLYHRVWNVFPEVKEGLLCGMAKVRFVVKKLLNGLFKPSVGDDMEASSKEKQQQLRKDNIANEIATLTKRDIWRYLILWEFGGTVIDLEVLQSLILTSDTTPATDDTTTSPLINVARQWFASEWFGSISSSSSSNNNEDDGDAIITMIEKDGKQRVPLTGVMTASPNHPLLYFCAKWALKSMIGDNYLVWGESPEFRAFNAMGRNTDVATLQEGLKHVIGKDWGIQSKQIGNANKCDVDKTKSVRFLNGNDIFPKSLASPMQDMMSIVKKHVDDKSELPEDDAIIKSFQGMEASMEKEHKEDKIYVSKPDPIIFSCMEYRLQAYTNNLVQ